MKKVMIVLAGIGVAAVTTAGILLLSKKVNDMLEKADNDDEDFDAFAEDFDDFYDDCDEQLHYVDIFPTKAEAEKMEEEASK